MISIKYGFISPFHLSDQTYN